MAKAKKKAVRTPWLGTVEWEATDPDVDVPDGCEVDYGRTVFLGNGRYKAPLIQKKRR